jgi:Tol biopolymer transport system component/DNA-binding winged helix-turn-helix (wHTH) protein
MIYVFGPFVLDARKGSLWRGKDTIDLPPRVYAVLCLLLENHGAIVSKSTLIAGVWPESYVGESSLAQTIFLLRKALGPSETGDAYIETHSKRGYRIAVPVTLLSEPIPEPPPEEPQDKTSETFSAQELHQELLESPAAVMMESSVPTSPPGPPEILPPQVLVEPSVPSKSHPQGQTGRVLPSHIFRPIALWSIAGLILLASAFAVVHKRWLPWRKPNVVRFSRLTNDGIYKERLISLLTDGSRVFFSEDIDATSYLAEVSTEGGETIRRKAPDVSASALSFSPVRREILFGSLWEQSPDHPMVTMSLPEGILHSLGDLSGHAASWSPDGTSIVFAKGVSLYVAQADGSKVHEIAHMREAPYWPRWSPDGSRIRFSLQLRSNLPSLWEVGADGRSLHPLLPNEPQGKIACCGDWSPDGRYYVFVVEQSQRSSLWVMRDRKEWWQTSSPIQLADGPADFWRAPLVAPDGKHIFALGEQARGELLKYDAQAQHFLPHLDGLSTDTISFSRDGQWMAYTLFPEGTLWRSRVDGSERLRLTEGPGVARFPQWSPDGSQILFITAGTDNVWKVNRIAASGGRSEILVPGASNQGVATWSPDGKRIAFGQLVTFGVDANDQQIQILDLASRKLSVVPKSSGLWTARWSPDGRFLSAVTTDNRKLMLYDFEHTTWGELADTGINDVVWGRNSDEIYFDSPNDAAVYRVDLKSRQVKRFASLQGVRRTGFFGWSINIAPDNTLILLREAGIHEVYSLEVRLP